MSSLPVYQLKITLNDIKPPIWRRVLVSEESTLNELHEIIQAVMPWFDAHLHEFHKGRVRYGIPEYDDMNPTDFDSRMTTLDEVFSSPKDKIMYWYDFGDDWRHTIILEKTLPLDPDGFYPVCTAGKRACPPEDCGGPWGYQTMLEALHDPNHPEHEMYTEWLDYEFDPEEFDVEEANDDLQKDVLADDLTMAPINRHAVILIPKPPVFDWLESIGAAPDTENELFIGGSSAFLAPVAPDVHELKAFVREMKPMLIMYNLMYLGVDLDEIEELPDELGTWYDMKICPFIHDIYGVEPIIHLSLDLTDIISQGE